MKSFMGVCVWEERPDSLMSSMIDPVFLAAAGCVFGVLSLVGIERVPETVFPKPPRDALLLAAANG